jgi:hypothetical protein
LLSERLPSSLNLDLVTVKAGLCRKEVQSLGCFLGLNLYEKHDSKPSHFGNILEKIKKFLGREYWYHWTGVVIFVDRLKWPFPRVSETT